MGWRNILIAVTAFMAVGPLFSAEGAGEQGVRTDPNGLPIRESFVFQPLRPDVRRDVFHDLRAELQARWDLDLIVQKGSGGTPPPESGPRSDGISPPPGQQRTQKEAESQAQAYVDRIKIRLINENWDGVIADCDKYLQDTKLLQDDFPESSRLQQVAQLLRRFRTQAEEKKLYEEARAQFESLKLAIEGIIWSADQPSLVIIAGEPVARGIKDRVKDNCEIINVDPSRVDFMFAYRRRQYHFQIYLEPQD